MSQHTSGAGTVQSIQRLATGWMVRGSNAVGGTIFALLHTFRPALEPTQPQVISVPGVFSRG